MTIMKFTIKDKDTSILMVETHYYKWLEEKQPMDIHTIKTKTDYLSEQGFVVGVDKISEEELKTLKYVEQHYFSLNLKSKL
jgi:hypothetical protein